MNKHELWLLLFRSDSSRLCRLLFRRKIHMINLGSHPRKCKNIRWPSKWRSHLCRLLFRRFSGWTVVVLLDTFPPPDKGIWPGVGQRSNSIIVQSLRSAICELSQDPWFSLEDFLLPYSLRIFWPSTIVIFQSDEIGKIEHWAGRLTSSLHDAVDHWNLRDIWHSFSALCVSNFCLFASS
jgi:hypothetical protein